VLTGVCVVDGKIYAIGGNDIQSQISMESFDPREGKWKLELPWEGNLHKTGRFHNAVTVVM